MIALSAEQQTSFRGAVAAASHRLEVRSRVRALYEHLQDAIDLRSPRCDASGRCCKFEEFGHRLFVTTVELAAFMAELDPTVRRVWMGHGCPFQAERLCGVHSIRPFGCRMFFCDPTAGQWQREQYERFHRLIKQLHVEMVVPYFYVEWREALACMGLLGLSPPRVML